MAKVTIPIKVLPNGKDLPLPQYATEGSAAVDLYAAISKPIKLNSLERTIIPTGIAVALPQGFEAQIRPRSGLAIQQGLSMVNAPGTIDSDYRGEIGVIVINLSKDILTIKPKTRIAQMVVAQYERIEWQPTTKLPETKRGTGSFGSTGTK